MGKKYLILLTILLLFSLSLFAQKKIVLGFSQIGAESDWRIANTKSVKDAAAKAGIDLKFSDAQQNQANQIKAIKSFIAQKVDVIAFCPVVETGWDDVLNAAKRANIPVILVDRNIDTKDDSLWVTKIGSDFYEEGIKAGNWLLDYIPKMKKTGTLNLVELEGTPGSAPALDRKRGFMEVIGKNPNIKVLQSETAYFTKAKGKEMMATFLKKYGKSIDILFAHNDDMALGAIQAIEEAGLKPGEDIIIVSVDATKAAFQAIIDGKMNVTVECSPLLGPQLMDAVKKLKSSGKLPKKIITIEGLFDSTNARQEIKNRVY